MSIQEAIAHLKNGRPRAAVLLLQETVKSEPSNAQAWFLLGAACHVAGELSPAAEAFSQSLQLDARNVDACLGYATVRRALSEPREALARLSVVRDLVGNDARLQYAAAVCHEDLGELDAALRAYDDALRLSPALADALHNRGLVLTRMGRLWDAEVNQRRFVDLHPSDIRAPSGLADVLLARGKHGEALEWLEHARRLAPEDISVRVRQGVALSALRRFDEARTLLADVSGRHPRQVHEYLRRISPGSTPELMLSPENLYLWECYRGLQRCDWSYWTGLAEELVALPTKSAVLVEPAVAFIAFHSSLEGPARTRVAAHVAARIQKASPPLSPPPSRRPGPLRIGILSPDFREHLNAYLLLPFFELVDRDRFEPFAYSTAPADGSDIRGRIERCVPAFRDLGPLGDEEAAAAIRADDIDILLDVGGHTTGARFSITARRPARVQAGYLGFAGSLGSSRVDFAITDAIAGGDADEWTEDRVFLPHTYYLYDFRAPVPDAGPKRADYGLPEDRFVFCAFHKAEKISPDTFALWMKVLQRVPRSVLWMLSLSDAAQENLRREATRYDVDPQRLIFAPFDPRDRYLARHRLGDLMLDAIHHSAMTTACDAMAAGLPVLTLRGKAMASRAGESLVRAAGLPDLVALSQEEFIEKAVRTAQEPDRLAGYRETLLSRAGPLFDTVGRVRELEAALQEMWDRHLARTRA